VRVPRPAADLDKQLERAHGGPLVTINVKLANQDGMVLVDAKAEAQAPL
jgi:hypothetical protein